MIIDVTGVELLPGNNGIYCKGNGLHKDDNGMLIECCCDECDYLKCCVSPLGDERCNNCSDQFCPNSNHSLNKTT